MGASFRNTMERQAKRATKASKEQQSAGCADPKITGRRLFVLMISLLLTFEWKMASGNLPHPSLGSTDKFWCIFCSLHSSVFRVHQFNFWTPNSPSPHKPPNRSLWLQGAVSFFRCDLAAIARFASVRANPSLIAAAEWWWVRGSPKGSFSRHRLLNTGKRYKQVPFFATVANKRLVNVCCQGTLWCW